MVWDREKERKAGRSVVIGGSVVSILFIAVWCLAAIAMGAWFMALFGLPLLGFVIYRLAVILRKEKETEKRRTQAGYEPWSGMPHQPLGTGEGFCPYCGRQRQEDFVFCPTCGRRL